MHPLRRHRQRVRHRCRQLRGLREGGHEIVGVNLRSADVIADLSSPRVPSIPGRLADGTRIAPPSAAGRPRFSRGGLHDRGPGPVALRSALNAYLQQVHAFPLGSRCFRGAWPAARTDGSGAAGGAADTAAAAAPDPPAFEREITLTAGDLELAAHLAIPDRATGAVIFALGSGSSRRSPRDRLVAAALNQAGLGTLLADLLTPEEALRRANVFDVRLLAARLTGAPSWSANWQS